MPKSDARKGAVNVKPQIIAAGENGIVRFVTRTAAGGNGEGFSRLRIRYDTSKIIKNDIWKPKGCIDAALGIEDGMAEGAVKCTDMPDVGTDGCVWLNGVSVVNAIFLNRRLRHKSFLP